MSDLIDLAARLRKLDEASLAQVLEGVSSAQSLGDLFDLARALLSKSQLETRIRTLDSESLNLLRNGASNQYLSERFLGTEEHSYEAATALAQELQPITQKALKLDLSCAELTNYETQLALTELLFACERHYLEVMRQGLRAADTKGIAQTLKLEVPRLQLIFQLAQLAGLVTSFGDRYVASEAGMTWLEQDPAERWLVLATAIWDLPKLENSQGHLGALLSQTYPLLDIGKLNFLRFSHLLGLTSNLEMTPLMAAASADLANAAVQVKLQYPAPATRVILQGDLSIVAPGPVNTQVHRQLDLVAQSEDLGLACRFRLSMNSVLHAMETGLSSEAISDLLEQLSSSKLPQPMHYLIGEVQRKFGELRVSEFETGALLKAKDPIVLAQISNEATLNSLMLKRSADGLVSRLAPELIYFNLRDAGYPVVMVDGEGQIISPRVRQQIEIASNPDLNLALAKSLMTQEAREPDAEDQLRQLQFALKNKLKVGLRVDMPEGELEFQMTPLGIAGGRFRGRDVEKEAERTLPLSRIKAVWLS